MGKKIKCDRIYHTPEAGRPGKRECHTSAGVVRYEMGTVSGTGQIAKEQDNEFASAIAGKAVKEHENARKLELI